jgi:hypothetical protein
MTHILFALFISMQAYAVDVAFLEVHGKNGKPLQLEPGGRFMHVAIRYGGLWLQAHPQGGVNLVRDIEMYGDVIVILRDSRRPDPRLSAFVSWLGKPFDYSYRWDNPAATYCTRMVAEVLGIKPLMMEFSSEHWKLHRSPNAGGLGLSPDDLYKILREDGWTEVEDCARRLEKVS